VLDQAGDSGWAAFTAAVAAHPVLVEQPLLSLLTEPCQRAIRYGTEAAGLLQEATSGDRDQVPHLCAWQFLLLATCSVSRFPVNCGGVAICIATPGTASLSANAYCTQVVGTGGLTLGAVSKQPSLEAAVRLEQWAAAGEGRLAVPDLPEVVRAFVNLKGETWRLNNKQRERERGLAEARRAQALLAGLRGLEGVLERPVGVRSECSVMCTLPGHPEQEYAALLLQGNRRCLALCTDLLQPDRRACHWSVDLAHVEAVTVQHSTSSAAAAGGGVIGEPVLGGVADENAGGLTLVLRLAPEHRRDSEHYGCDSLSDAATGRGEFTSGVGGGSTDGDNGGSLLTELELRSPASGAGSASEGATPPPKSEGSTFSLEAVPLAVFARELVEAVGAEAAKRQSLSSARRSVLMVPHQSEAGGVL
jgi:hypothetical protein